MAPGYTQHCTPGASSRRLTGRLAIRRLITCKQKQIIRPLDQWRMHMDPLSGVALLGDEQRRAGPIRVEPERQLRKWTEQRVMRRCSGHPAKRAASHLADARGQLSSSSRTYARTIDRCGTYRFRFG